MVGSWPGGPGRGMPEEGRRAVRSMLRAGASWREVQDRFGISHQLVWRIIREAGGMPPSWSSRSKKHLSIEDREEVFARIGRGETFAKIAEGLGRPTSTISREVKRNGGRDAYRPVAADRATCVRAKRPRPTVFETNLALKMVVESWLGLKYSPKQISGRLRAEFPDNEKMRVAPETIYQALFVQARGGLNKELVKYLRTNRRHRRPRSVTARNGDRGRISDMVMISQRPAEIEDRAVPGHWEGDLIIGKNGKSQVGTLVERTTGLVLLIELPDGRTADCVAEALQRQIATLPAQACKTITWDQGKEMAGHAAFTVATAIPVFFCDPHSPWQRGSNENTNGLLRQYMPNGTDLSIYSQAELDDIAAELNNRPRERHEFLTPLEVFNKLVLQ